MDLAWISALTGLFSGSPWPVAMLYWIVLAIIVSGLVSVITLLVQARAFRRFLAERARRRQTCEADFLWVFLVPALDEEVTIADSVQRLAATAASNAVFLVIDDGSQDRTGGILAQIEDERLHVLTRVPPQARRGKAAALNDAYRHLRSDLLRRPEFSRWNDEDVIIGIVDADGRLQAEAPVVLAEHFGRRVIGGAQVLVRIYNRRGWLTWCQDVEFTSFGRLFQAGRSAWGSANMGGNGQFTRLSALAAVDAGDGPWRDKLTEDQDLGVRLVEAGWSSVQENRVRVDQQGLNNLRRLYRQRVRWAQGNWQALSLLPGVHRAPIPWLGRVDSVYYLLSPVLQLITGIGFVTSVVELVLQVARSEPVTFGAWWVVIIFLGLSLGPSIITLSLRGGRWYSPVLGVLLSLPYSVYSWIIFPVLATALVRQLAGRTSWAKTARESLQGPETVTG